MRYSFAVLGIVLVAAGSFAQGQEPAPFAFRPAQSFDKGSGVVGYIGSTSPISGAVWLRHAMERFKRLGINHDAWSVDGGFTWNVPSAREELIRFWKENR